VLPILALQAHPTNIIIIAVVHDGAGTDGGQTPQFDVITGKYVCDAQEQAAPTAVVQYFVGVGFVIDVVMHRVDWVGHAADVETILPLQNILIHGLKCYPLAHLSLRDPHEAGRTIL